MTMNFGRVLMIVDQLSFAVLEVEHQRRGISPPTPVRLDYIPRSTPVGHATLSTGLLPSVHRVQGRVWWASDNGVARQHEIEHLPHGGLCSTIKARLKRHSLARRLKRDRPGIPVIAVSAKSFISYLLGAWDTDVSVYPTSERPESLPGGGFGFIVALDAFTDLGARALTRARADIEKASAAMAGLVGATVRTWLDPPANGGGRILLRVGFEFPGTDRISVGRPMGAAIFRYAVRIDQFYAGIADLLAAELGDPRTTLLHHWFSTDLLGHREGPGSAPYLRALHAAIDVAQRWVHDGSRVVLTSDHGSRCTPRWWPYRAQAGHPTPQLCDEHGTQVPLPPHDRLVRDADHLVGYESAPASSTEVHYWDGRRCHSTGFSQWLATRSHHPNQRPRWMLLPASDARLSDAPRPAGAHGGGDHGASVDLQGTIVDDDNEVPLWVNGGHGISSPLPTELHQIADWFSQLPQLP